MLELGKYQKLMIVRQKEFGVYLAEEKESRDTVLLPRKQVPEGKMLGDMLEVFLYKDSQDRLIATTAEPLLTVGELAVLRVKEIAGPGAFLEWGLEKDLLLPFREQTKKVEAGEECLVTLYIDKTGRLCATMKVYPYLSLDALYEKEDIVEGVIYQITEDFGVYVAVDNQYSARIPSKESFGEFKVGDKITARVIDKKEDGKMELSVRKKGFLQIDDDAELVMKGIQEYGGVLPFTDKASPEAIKREFQLSKNAFKRAVGRLLKEGRIEIKETCIKKVTKEICSEDGDKHNLQ